MSGRYRTGSTCGVTLVELLIAIIIATCVFLAMVPLFVLASKNSSGDKARVVALNIAQDRIEKIRQLSFSSLTSDRLNVADSTDPFATTQYEDTAAGKKPFSVHCDVVDLRVSTTDWRVVSRKATVTVGWSTPPPGGSVSVSTIVYKEYPGPQITNFTVTPYDVDQDVIPSTQVSLAVTVSAADLDSMRPALMDGETRTGYVSINIAPMDGSVVIAEIRVPYDSAHPAAFTAPWTASNEPGVGDGYYRFTAVAHAADGSAGNSWSFSKRIESGPPGPVRDLVGIAAIGSASLTWLPSLSGDVDHYEVYRTNGPNPGPDGTTVLIAGNPSVQPKWKETGLTDTGLTIHEYYTYTIYVYDQSNPKKRTPATLTLYVKDASDISPPLPATNLKADPNANAAALVWQASASTFVLGYQVFANGDTTNPVKTVSTPYATVPQTWATIAWYQVKPYRDPLLLSDSWASIMSGYPSQLVGTTPWVKVTTQAQTLYSLTVVNDVSATNKRANISLYYLGPSGSDVATQVGVTKTMCHYGNTSDAVWTGLPYGTYRWSWTTTDQTPKTGQREEAFAVGLGGVVSITRHCIAQP